MLILSSEKTLVLWPPKNSTAVIRPDVSSSWRQIFVVSTRTNLTLGGVAIMEGLYGGKNFWTQLVSL